MSESNCGQEPVISCQVTITLDEHGHVDVQGRGVSLVTLVGMCEVGAILLIRQMMREPTEESRIMPPGLHLVPKGNN